MGPAMRGTELVLICLLLLSQTNLAREKKAEYAHSGRSVLAFLDREFWDRDEGGFYANPYGNMIKLVDQQALVAQAHYDLYNSTRDKRHLERAEEIMEMLEVLVLLGQRFNMRRIRWWQEILFS